MLALALMLTFVLLGFLIAVGAVVTTELIEIFSFSSAKIGLLTSVFVLACCLAGIPSYRAAARWGGRMLAIGVALAVVGSAVFALSSSFVGFMGARFLQGAGAGSVVAMSAAVLTGKVVPRLQDRALQICSLGAGPGVVLALIVMPGIQGAGGYRTVFLAAAGIVFVLGAGPLAHPAVRAIRSDGAEGIPLRVTPKALADAAAHPRMWLIAFMNAATMAVAVTLVLWIPIFLQDQKGASLASAAHLSAWLGVACLVGGAIGAVAAAQIAKPFVPAALLGLMTAAAALVPVPAATAAAFGLFMVAMFLSALTIRRVWSAVSRVARPEQVKPAKGFLSLTTFIGAGLAPWLYGVALDAYGAAPREPGYVVAHLVVAAFAFVGAVCAVVNALLVRKRPS